MNLIDGAKEQLKSIHRDIKSTAKVIFRSSKKWYNISAIPTVDVDVVLVFSRDCGEGFREWFMKEIETNVPELSFSLNYHKNVDEYALYLSSSYQHLLRGAEMLHIRKKVSPEFGGGYREFNIEELDLFQDVSDENLFLSTQDRQSIVLYWLNSLKAKTEINKFSVPMLPNQNMVPVLLAKGKISQIFPLHNYESLKNLGYTWVTKFLSPQPLDEIAGYFGIKIALYFAWLGHYTTALFIPTLIGIIGWHFTPETFMDSFYVFNAFFNIIWATFYLKHWRRTSNELTYKWGTIDYKIYKQPVENPNFRADTTIVSGTGETMKYYPEWKRQMILYFVSLPVIVVCFATIIMVSVAFNEFQIYIDYNIDQKKWYSILSPIPKVILSLTIGFMEGIFKKVASRLTDLENHQMMDTRSNYLMAKNILFQFMNSFFCLFYLAFYHQDLPKLREQLATLLITRQFVGNIKEIVLPYINTRLRQTIMGIRYEQRRTLAYNARQSAKLAVHLFDSTESQKIPAERPKSLEREQTVRQLKTVANVDSAEDRETKQPRSHGEDRTQTMSFEESSTTNCVNPEDDTSVDTSLHVNISDPPGEPTVKPLDEEELEDENTRRAHQEILTSKRSSVSVLSPDETTIVQAEEEGTLPKYDDPFDDFLEMFLQFGFVSMFASAFPLAGLFCLLNNILEIRSDAFKLVSSFQRPFGVQVSSIGVWQKALEAMSYLAIAVNVGLLVVSGSFGRIMKGSDAVLMVISVFVIEHIIVMMKFVIEQGTSNVPFWIDSERKFIEKKRREALKELEKEAMREKRRQRESSSNPGEEKKLNPEVASAVSMQDNYFEIDETSSNLDSTDDNNSCIKARVNSKSI